MIEFQPRPPRLTRRTVLTATSASMLALIGGPIGDRRLAKAQEATPVVAKAPAMPPEVLLTTTFSVDQLPQGPAAVEFWYSNWEPGFEYLAEQYHPSVSVGGDLVLSGSWGSRSDVPLLIWRDGKFQDVPANQEVVLQPGEAVIYRDNAANEWIRNAAETATETANFAITLGDDYQGPNLGVDWEALGLSGHDVTVSIERQILAPGEALTFTPDQTAPAIPLVIEGTLGWSVVETAGKDTLPPAKFASGTTIPFMAPEGGAQIELKNLGDVPVVLLTMIMTAADAAAGTPVA